jgi:hypothetical protein
VRSRLVPPYLPVLQDSRHFRRHPCRFMHKNMLQMFEMYGIFGEDIQILFHVFGYYTHICAVKFGHLFSGKGQTKKSSML